MKSELPHFAGLQALPGRALPVTLAAIGLVLILFLPAEAIFLVALTAAIGTGISVADWRRAPDAPLLAPSRAE
jgi:hypothetical protein